MVRFTHHKYLLLAHSVCTTASLAGWWQVHECRPKDLALRYGVNFHAGPGGAETVRKNVNVLQTYPGAFQGSPCCAGKAELLGVIADYHQGLTPLIVPPDLDQTLRAGI